MPDKQDDEVTDDDYIAFSSTLEHGLQLHQEYMNTLEGKRELATLPPQLTEILAHYMQAAILWVGDEEGAR